MDGQLKAVCKSLLVLANELRQRLYNFHGQSKALGTILWLRYAYFYMQLDLLERSDGHPQSAGVPSPGFGELSRPKRESEVDGEGFKD